MPPTTKNKRRNKLNNNKKGNKNIQDEPKELPTIVGPDSIQVLQGNLFGKKVALVLCGETHEDAIDVTRKGGIFDPKEGWIELPKNEILFDMNHLVANDDGDDKLMMRVFASTSSKLVTLGPAKDWAKKRLEDMDLLGQVVLLWIQETPFESRVPKGKAYLLGFTSLDSLDEDDDEDNEFDEWFDPNEENCLVPSSVLEWLLQGGEEAKGGKQKSLSAQLSQKYRSFEWGDLDPQAFELNRRRLTDEEIATSEIDSIVEDRKSKLRTNENIWTWDDWFQHIREQTNSNGDNAIDIHLIIESSVPPWELSLHRPKVTDNINFPPAPDFIRCMPEDDDGDIEDEYDPSSDGVGSFLDYVYRKFMEAMIGEQRGVDSNGGDDLSTKSTWLHCVDARDLGCQSACHSESIKDMWNKTLLNPEEAIELLDIEKGYKQHFVTLEADKSNQHIKFVPENRMNPERIELEKMRSSGVLTIREEDVEDQDLVDGDDFTFPSFEGFFGQSTDFLYYSPHVHLYYSPFLAKNVKSLANWGDFFTGLFLGGTISEALELLDLGQGARDHLYVRSPIRKSWNDEKECFEYTHREDSEHYITYPFFPFLFYLCANGSNPPRTFSSQIFARLCEEGEEPSRVATAAREWTVAKVKQHCSDPKAFDDPQCGGEWFCAYLYHAHRDIYVDIDHSDPTVLLQKNHMKSLSSGRKYNIGKIRIPSCEDAFTEILEHFGMIDMDDKTEHVVTPRVEVLAKILLDIWMSCLVDFTTILKITELISSQSSRKKVLITAYMGSAHTRALTEFFSTKLGFKKKSFVGKTVWDEDEPRNMRLPNNLWEIENLFK